MMAHQPLVLLSVLFCLGLVCISDSQNTILQNMFDATQAGDGTYYGQSTGGNCGYGTLFPSFAGYNAGQILPVALNANQYAGNDQSQGCGVCMSVQGTGTGSGANPIQTSPPFTVFVHDQCPGCSNGDIDLAESGDGRWQITWKAVACPVNGATLQYKLQGSNPWYLKLQVVGHTYPVASVQFTGSDGKLYEGTRTQDNFWNPASNAPGPFSFPLTIVVVSLAGESLTDSIPSLTNDILLNGNGVQFSTAPRITEDGQAISESSSTGLYIGIGVACGALLIVVVVIVVVLIKRNNRRPENI